MRKIKILTISLCVSIMLCLSIGLFSLGETPRVYAEGNTNYFTVEEYTDYDELLRSDGTSSDKDIQTFANEVKAGKNTLFRVNILKVRRRMPHLHIMGKNTDFML